MLGEQDKFKSLTDSDGVFTVHTMSMDLPLPHVGFSVFSYSQVARALLNDCQSEEPVNLFCNR